MDREQLSTFLRTAENDLASVRRSLLIVAQSGDASGLQASRRVLTGLGKGALSCGQPAIAAHIADFDSSLDRLITAPLFSSANVNASLDQLAAVEAALLSLPIHSSDFLPNVGEFVDDSFEQLIPHMASVSNGTAPEEFEIDEDTLEIFRAEADELIAGIDANIRKLLADTSDQTALWEIRRNAHTVKGAAGIVGLRAAAETAHRMEDLLDRLVELRIGAPPAVIAFLDGSTAQLKSTVDGCGSPDGNLDEAYRDAVTSLDSSAPKPAPDAAHVSHVPDRSQPVKPPTGPIVRVSLERLDELIRLSRTLLVNNSAVANRFAEFHDPAARLEALAELDSIVDTQTRLIDEIQSKLQQIRMVKFGNLETRLARTVHVTSIDEDKVASLVIENPNVEIDTQVIDMLIEPLLHLLKNAVVHGIETPDVRRLIGKSEKGVVRISIEADEDILVMTVKDDGAGISVAKLKERALANNADADLICSMSDHEAMRLIFDRGLTTAEKVDLNAGRGLGMSIVKEAVEACGGSVHVESTVGQGSSFTLILSLAPAVPAAEPVLVAQPEIKDAENARLVLIVDDSMSIRTLTARHIEDAGFRAITANNGAEALELLLSGAHEPDLILSDVEMPQIDGWALLEYVKTDENLGHIPVVLVTSLDADEYRERAFGLGASDYVVKPFGANDLDRVLGIIAPVAA